MLPAILAATALVCAADVPAWRQSLDVCWRDATCQRALLVTHGGASDYVQPPDAPYDSLPAFEAAVNFGTDAVKGDLRVTRDNVSMVMHSSPIEIYESLECVGRKVEQMTAAECEKCPMFPTENVTFISAGTLLNWANGKCNVMFCVKEATDIARAISTLVEFNATHRAFLEIGVGNLQDMVLAAQPPRWDQVFYLAEMSSAADIDTLLSAAFAPLLPRLFAFEFDPSWPTWGINVTDAIVNRLHPAGVRSLAATSTFLPSVDSQEALFKAGFDVVYTYDTTNGVKARTLIDIARGISPP